VGTSARHPPLGLVDVFAATIPTLPFVAAVHVTYAETVLPMPDGLSKGEGDFKLNAAGAITSLPSRSERGLDRRYPGPRGGGPGGRSCPACGGAPQKA
jgi:hypothetical protein